MLHLKNSGWSKVEQVERETVLKPAPPPPPSRREVVWWSSGAGPKKQGGAKMVEQESGLTPFIIAMLRTDPAAIARADPAKLAAKYKIPATTAQFYLREYRG